MIVCLYIVCLCRIVQLCIFVVNEILTPINTQSHTVFGSPVQYSHLHVSSCMHHQHEKIPLICINPFCCTNRRNSARVTMDMLFSSADQMPNDGQSNPIAMS